MRKIKLYTAVSIDGFIATPQGDISWLTAFPNEEKTDYGYEAFIRTIDITLMGHNTYKHLLQLAATYPYTHKTNYVFTRRQSLPVADHVQFINGDVVAFTTRLKNTQGRDIWLAGGGQLNGTLLQAGLIDETILHLIPLTLGRGIPLFGSIPAEQRLLLEDTRSYSNGVLELRYTAKSNGTL